MELICISEMLSSLMRNHKKSCSISSVRTTEQILYLTKASHLLFHSAGPTFTTFLKVMQRFLSLADASNTIYTFALSVNSWITGIFNSSLFIFQKILVLYHPYLLFSSFSVNSWYILPLFRFFCSSKPKPSSWSISA